MLSKTTWRKRHALKRAEKQLGGATRFVDLGVLLHVVRQDERGKRVLHGRPKIALLRVHRFGGLYDRVTRRFVGPSRRPVRWFCGEAVEPLLLHQGAPRLLAYGAEGSGKTQTLAKWLLLRALEHAGHDRVIGATSPTNQRMRGLLRAIGQKLPQHWGTWVESAKEYRLCFHTTIQCVSVAKRSDAEGSPIQGWNWVACGSDEFQDQFEANDDIETRGRDAPDGMYRRFCTATAKDSSAWRTFRDGLLRSSYWQIARLAGWTNPFVEPMWWEQLRHTLAPREYKRRVLAEDVGPERQTYYCWERAKNLVPVPPGFRDRTTNALRAWGDFKLLLGHDPGVRQDVTTVLKNFSPPRQALSLWWVVGELTTQQTTTPAHADALVRFLWERFAVRPEECLLFCDPQNEHETHGQPHVSVYRALRRKGFTVHSPARRKKRVPLRAGTEMVNLLLCSEAGDRRLFVEDTPHGPCAPNLVRAFESEETDLEGNPEAGPKDETDLSHWPASLRYALWPLEREHGPSGTAPRPLEPAAHVYLG